MFERPALVCGDICSTYYANTNKLLLKYFDLYQTQMFETFYSHFPPVY